MAQKSAAKKPAAKKATVKKPAAKKAAKGVKGPKKSSKSGTSEGGQRGSHDELTIIVMGGVVSECYWRSDRPAPAVVVRDYDANDLADPNAPAYLEVGGDTFCRSEVVVTHGEPEPAQPYVEDEHDAE